MNKYSLWMSGLIALVGSLVVNALVDTIFFPFTGVPAEVMTFKMLGPAGVFTILGVVGAVIVFAIVRRFAHNPNRLFIWISAGVLLVSFLPDIFVHSLGPMFSQVTPGGVVLLMVLHVTTALVTVSALLKLTKSVSTEVPLQ